MDPLMVCAEVKNTPLETLVYEYERVTPGEVGIMVWKRRATTESRRNWKGRPRYVPIAELPAVEADERRRKYRWWYSNSSPATKSKRKKTRKKYDDGRKEEAKKNRKGRKEEAKKNRKPGLQCVHNRNKYRCKDCGTGHCEHGRRENQCKDCGTEKR
jgi:hypothetical protein